MQAQYLRFFWPLALSSLIFALGNQLRNAALSRYPEPARELSTYAYAFSTWILLWAANNFVPQVANAYARSPRGTRVALTTVIALNVASATVLLTTTLSPLGSALLERAFGVHGRVAADVRLYILWLAPLLPASGYTQFLDGMLVQARHTRLVTLARLAQLVGMAGGLAGGMALGWGAIPTLVTAHYAASFGGVAVLRWAKARYYAPPLAPEHTQVTHLEVARFLLPTTVTSVMFSVTRPILYAALGRTADPLVGVAAMRIAYDMVASLQMVSNQFRHFFVTFGSRDDLAGKRRFMAIVALVLTGALAATLIPGPRELVFTTLLGVRGDVFGPAVAATTALIAVPAILMLRNYFHARLLEARAPNAMAFGSALRVVSVGGTCLALLSAGVLSAPTAALALGSGFVCEVLVSGIGLRLRRRSS